LSEIINFPIRIFPRNIGGKRDSSVSGNWNKILGEIVPLGVTEAGEIVFVARLFIVAPADDFELNAILVGVFSSKRRAV
jgi:hypothetical protein